MFVIVFVFVFVSVIVFFLVMSCLLITLIKCLKGHKSLGSLCMSKSKRSLSVLSDRGRYRAVSDKVWTAKNVLTIKENFRISDIKKRSLNMKKIQLEANANCKNWDDGLFVRVT